MKSHRICLLLPLSSLLLLALYAAACDERPSLEDRYASKSAGSTSASASATASATATASASASAVARKMPPRPVPYPSHGPVQPSDPPELQMMAIQYTIAMLAPQPSDPFPDEAAIEALTRKMSIGGVTASADKGNRLLVLDVKGGCTYDAPARLVRGRGGKSLKDLFDLGITVVKCHDVKWACHQSTRDPKDVLCHAAPRRMR